MAKKEEAELVYDWTRRRPRNDDFRCGWCAYYDAPVPQEENYADDENAKMPVYEFDHEVWEWGHCRCNPPSTVCVSDPNWKIKDVQHVGQIAVAAIWPYVDRGQTACKNFKSCFRKKGKDGEEKKGGTK